MSWSRSLSKNLKELRFIFCQTNDRSSNIRNFVAKNYWEIKQNNPQFPLLVRESQNSDPYIIARYAYGIEKKAFIAGNSEQEIQNLLVKLAEQTPSNKN